MKAKTLSLIVAALALLAGARGSALADEGSVFAIAEAPPLHWGFKASWRTYAPEPQVSGGASVVPSSEAPYDLEWDFESGSYDPATRTTRIDYSGTAHWQKYLASQLERTKPPGYTGPETDPYLLDVTISDPQLTIGADSSTITAIATSRNQTTWEMHSYGRVPIVNLDVLGVTPTVADGTTQWAGIAAAVTPEGADAFDGNYRVGQIVDDVGFSYAGPGGAPDFSEHWDQPGTVALELVQNELFVDGEEIVNLQPLWVDRKNMIVHSIESLEIDGGFYRRITAFGLREMEQLGEVVLPRSEAPEAVSVGAFDTSQDRILYRGSGESGMRRWLRFNREDKQYEHGVLADPQMGETSFFGSGNAPRLIWDPVRDRGYRIQRVVPPGVGSTEFDRHEWQLSTYHEGDDEIWVKKTFALPNFPVGENRTGYPAAGSSSAPTYATASDGSLIVLASTRTGVPTTTTIPAAYRIVFNGDDTAVDVQPLPIPDVTNTVNGKGVFQTVQASANGHVILLRGGGDLIHLRIDAEGQVSADPEVSVEENAEPAPYEEWRFAIDPADGTVWFGGNITRQIAAFGDGAFLGSKVFDVRNPRGGPVLVGDDHFVYAQTSDGGTSTIGGSTTWGYGKFKRLGLVPTVTAQPSDEAVSLSVGEAAEDATFTSTASGEPAPGRQWQVKAPGATKFVDVAGASGETLTVAATRGDGGAEYRAVYSNAAGRVATDPATLAVAYAPGVRQGPVNASAREGEDAEFSILGEGNPEPTVTWQRRVGGFWQDIAAGDDNFALDGNTLTVLDTNVEQSGALFRAKLVNSLGTVKSAEAKLTVDPRLSIPAGGLDLEGVSLEWTGNGEMQKAPPFGGSNYFSAGVSDGTEASYRAVDGNAAVFQRAAGGAETLATWTTRADHVADGGGQLVRLYGGAGRLEEDGSATVAWDGSFSVNFYGGLAPFTLGDPELTVGDDGTGELTADLVGCASSQANPNQCDPLPPLDDVTVATFSGVEVDPAGELAIEPGYAGVAVELPSGALPQDRLGAGWGAWPQEFVDFHLQTGLSSYWYSSGGAADAYKQPDPFLVDFEGGEAPAEPAPEGPASGDDDPIPPGPSASDGPRQAVVQSPGFEAMRTAKVGHRGLSVVAWLSCPGPSFCAVSTPERVRFRVRGRVFQARVLAPRVIEEGAGAVVRTKLPRAALRRLGRGTATIRVRVHVRSAGGSTARTLASTLSAS